MRCPCDQWMPRTINKPATIAADSRLLDLEAQGKHVLDHLQHNPAAHAVSNATACCIPSLKEQSLRQGCTSTSVPDLLAESMQSTVAVSWDSLSMVTCIHNSLSTMLRKWGQPTAKVDGRATDLGGVQPQRQSVELFECAGSIDAALCPILLLLPADSQKTPL